MREVSVSKQGAVLRQPESVRESALPSGVQRLERPAPMGRAVELAFLRWEKQQLGPTERFWRDFGMSIVHASPDRLVARSTGSAPCIAMADKGESNRFVGAAFRMSDDTDLQRYARDMGGNWLQAGDIPGGGRGIELLDPCGRSVWLLQGQQGLEPLPTRGDLTATTNTAHASPRVNRMVRTPIEPAQVVKLGHVVFQAVDFQQVAQWYLRVLGLIPTDVQYLADGSPNIAFCRFDLGSEPADHHSVVIVGGIEDKYEHSAYEVVDLDAIGQGQQVLRAQGHRHMWGIGRHLLGSQLFDYWYDPDGFEHEHYTDGDLFTADYETEYSPMEFGGIWAWGADAPDSMKPKKNLSTLVNVARLLRRKRLTPQRLKLLGDALSAPARPWN
jgi:hypothetical protein